MSESLAAQLLHGDTEVPCPECGYWVWIRLSEVVVQRAVLCPCCRVKIHLVDNRGGMQNAGDEAERKIKNALKGLLS